MSGDNCCYTKAARKCVTARTGSTAGGRRGGGGGGGGSGSGGGGGDGRGEDDQRRSFGESCCPIGTDLAATMTGWETKGVIGMEKEVLLLRAQLRLCSTDSLCCRS